MHSIMIYIYVPLQLHSLLSSKGLCEHDAVVCGISVCLCEYEV